MRCIKKKVNEEIARGWLGSDLSCPYHPSHFHGQDCSFCYCPFYPCNDETLGNNIVGRNGDIWNCSDCLFIHRTPVCKFVYSEIRRLGITEAEDPRFRDIFLEAKERFWRKGRAVMIVGATSDAGKSVTVAALCRILHRKGYLVAPFKAQNMSLNSKVSRDGSEIAMIQVLQAAAAGLKNPDAHMNPILLKPKGNMESQVIVRGKPYGDYDVKGYYDRFVPEVGEKVVEEEIDFLKNRYDYVLMEGAGSPAEINLYEKDLTNMRAARLADADVILVVNVEWGGSYAYALGTIELIPPEDRRRVKGIILNNVRGDTECLKPGAKELERLTGVPVIGIVGHCDAELPNEDSESLRGVRFKGVGKSLVGVVRFPVMSNFTDLDPLLMEDVSVVFAERPEDLEGVDAVVLPGTKNTVKDLIWMKESGIADKVRSLWKKVPIVGICGGYQMMGRTLDDPEGIEGGTPATYEGLGFFDNVTTFGEYKKTVRQDAGRLLAGEGGEVRGYELHMGQTEVGEEPLLMLERMFSDDEKEGSCRAGDMTFGTYLHGIFDMPAFRKYLLSFIGNGSDAEETKEVRDYDEVIEESIDAFADAFEAGLDMDALMKILKGSE